MVAEAVAPGVRAKVRAPSEESPNCGARICLSRSEGTVLDNVKAEQSDGTCNRKQTAFRLAYEPEGKGEMVR